MDSAKTDPDLGTYWAPEDRAWLWYNDTIETQAFALRTLLELSPQDSRRHGLVQWLFLNKKLNQWKSTRATAEVIYSLVWYLRAEGALSAREETTVAVGGQRTTFVFEPDRYTGQHNQVVVPGEKLDPKRDSAVAVEKGGKGLAFASATWHFSTEKLPAEERGDFFSVSRKYFKRAAGTGGFVLEPLAEGAAIAVGDQIEVQISLKTKHAAEYVHLRDPRAAGLRARERPLALQVGSRNRLVRGDAGLGLELLLRAAAGGRVHVQVPRPRQHGRHLPRRPGHGAVDVRARVQRVLERARSSRSANRASSGPSSSSPGPRERSGRSSFTRPSRTASPSARIVGPVTRVSPTNVPFLLSRSSSVHVPPRTVIRACRRDSDASGMAPRAAVSRPRMFSPSWSGTSHSPQINRQPDGGAGRRGALERVAEPVNGPDQPVLPGGVGELRPNLVDQRGQARVGHERVRPQRALQLVLRHRPGTVLDEQREQLKGLRGEVDGIGPAEDLVAIGVQRDGSELEAHLRNL